MKKKKIKTFLLRLFISLFIIGFIFYGMRDYQEDIIKNIRSLDLLMFLSAVAVYIFISALGAYRLSVLMSAHGIFMPFSHLLKNMYIGYLFNLFLLGSTGGDAVRSYYIAKETHRKTEVITLIFFDRLIGMTTMMFIALSALLFNLQHAQMRGLAVAVVIVLCGILGFFVILLNKNFLIKFPLIQKITDRMFFKETLKKIYHTMVFFKNHKAKILWAFVLSVTIQSLAIITCYVVALSLVNIQHVSLKYFFLFMPIIFTASALPLVPGGWGVFEGAFIVCFSIIGVEEGDAFSMGLMNRLVLIILGLIGGVIYMLPGTEHIAAQAIEEGVENLEDEIETDNKTQGESFMKGVILAGGLGTRLYPLTRITNKHLLPIYDKPMIYYPIEKLVQAGIKDILIVTGGNFAGDFLMLLRNGKEFGLKEINYAYQEGQGGIAEALKLAEDFADNENILVILGDNVIEDDLGPHVRKFEKQNEGARIFLKKVAHPQRFGVPVIKGDKIIKIEEKPKDPKSSYAVTGIYMYDSSVFKITDTLKPSRRGELEITDVNNSYINKGLMSYSVLKGFWSDAGTFDSLFTASELIRKKALKDQKKSKK